MEKADFEYLAGIDLSKFEEGEYIDLLGKIFLKTDTNRIKVPMYIDSGADITIIPRILGVIGI